MNSHCCKTLRAVIEKACGWDGFEQYDKQFIEKDEIGKGRFGTVVRVTGRDNNHSSACKTIPFDNNIDACDLREDDYIADDSVSRLERMLAEVVALQRLQWAAAPCVVNAECFYFDPRKGVRIVMELYNGDLISFLIDRSKTYEYVDEAVIWDWASDLTSAVAACHKFGVVHRDIKPDNILLLKVGEELDKWGLVLSDFGLCDPWYPQNLDSVAHMTTFNHEMDYDTPFGAEYHQTCLPPNESTESEAMRSTWCLARDICGTMVYSAPELIRGKLYGPKVDVWSTGCVLVNLTSLSQPFDPASIDTMLESVAGAPANCVLPDMYSTELTTAIHALVQPDMELRPHASTMHAMFEEGFQKFKTARDQKESQDCGAGVDSVAEVGETGEGVDSVEEVGETVEGIEKSHSNTQIAC